MNVRNGSDGLHLDPQNCEIWGFSGFQPDRRDGLKSVLRVGGPIFGKATKVAIMHFPLNYFGCEPHGTPKYSVPISGIVRVKSRRRSITMGSFAGAVFGLVGVLGA